jgi:hypothetical protein
MLFWVQKINPENRDNQPRAVWLLPPANQSSGSLFPVEVPGIHDLLLNDSTRYINIMHKILMKYFHSGSGLSSAASALFGSLFCCLPIRFFRKGVKKATRRDLIMLISGPSKQKYKQWNQSSASPPWPWPLHVSQLMNSVEVQLWVHV